MKRKTIYLFTLICSISMICSARQRYYDYCLTNEINRVVSSAKAAECAAKETGSGYDLSPVGFFVLNM